MGGCRCKSRRLSLSLSLSVFSLFLSLSLSFSLFLSLSFARSLSLPLRYLLGGVHHVAAGAIAALAVVEQVVVPVVGVLRRVLLRPVALPGKGNSNSHGARPVHLTIAMIQWIRTRRLSSPNELRVGFCFDQLLCHVYLVLVNGVSCL